MVKVLNPRIDTLRNVLVREELKILIKSDKVVVHLGVVFLEYKQMYYYVAPYQIKANIAYPVTVLANEMGIPVEDYVVEQSMKKYSPLYYSLNDKEGNRNYIKFRVTFDKTGNRVETKFNYFPIPPWTGKDGQIYCDDLTSSLDNQTKLELQEFFYSRLEKRITGYVDKVLR